MENEKDKVTIKIPRPLYEKLKVVLEGSGYNSVTDFVVYVLRDLVASSDRSHKKINEKEIDEIKMKLKNLGYL
jgi:metal-responsive CopG/Arc/MetJ family transcriptional regulator